MCVIYQGKGEVAMTEGELAKFFGVSWQKVNHKVRLIKQTIREFGIRKGLKKLVISSKIRIFIGENQ